MAMIDKIRCIECEIMEEIDGAKEYLKLSKDWVEADPEVSKMYLKMAKEELSHATNLNTMVTKVMKDMNAKELAEFPALISEINSKQIKDASDMFAVETK